MDLEYVNVNEEGEEYDTHDSLDAALGILATFPNDTIVIRNKAVARAVEFSDDDARDLMDTLDDMLDHFDDVLNTAEINGYRAVQHKLEEAIGPLRSAREAAEQYADGRLRVRNAD